MMPAEARRLQHWTAQAVECMFTIWRDADEASFSTETSASIANALQMVTRTLRAAAQEAIPLHPFCTLPRHVLCNIRSHLTLADAVALSRTSRSLNCVVFCSPELWTDISTPSGCPTWVPYPYFHVFAWHSVAEALRISLLTTADMFVSQLPSLAYAMPRVTTLRLCCWDLPRHHAPFGWLRRGQVWSQLLVQVLTEPAPRLASFQLRHVEGEGLDSYWDTVDPIEIYYPLFSGMAPCLRRCRLGSVLFPPSALCGAAFRNVTTFSYTLSTEISPATIALIVEAMPRLEVLELDASDIDDSVEQHQPAVQCPSLRVVLGSIIEFQLEQLSPLLPLQQLQELWLFASSSNLCEELGKLYPSTEGMQLDVQHRDGIVASLCAGSGSSMPKVVFNSGDDQRLPEFLAPFASITWLCLHEHLFNNSEAGSPPPLHALQVLCVRLAAPEEYVASGLRMRYPAHESSGFLVGDLDDPPWELPGLREVRIGAPFIADSSGIVPLSISLHDVARWIRHGLAFGSSSPGAIQRLDTVVLSGLWVADFDFCAGWNTLREETESIQLEELSDSTYFPEEDLIYQTRSAALFPN